MNRIALAYAGVHQIFQLALAAHEIGELEGLLCSIIDGEKKWGRLLSKIAPNGTIRPLGRDCIPTSKIHEYPWPLIANRLMTRAFPKRKTDYLNSNTLFDRYAATWLRSKNTKVFVGSESCALECFRRGREMGMKLVLDCPGIPYQVLDTEIGKGLRKFGLESRKSLNSPKMVERKRRELELADIVLCCSEFQRDWLQNLNPQIQRCEVIPLWTDVDFWGEARPSRSFNADHPIRLLYAGTLSVAKGVPYLLEAVEPLATNVELTLVGKFTSEMWDFAKRFRSHRIIPPVSKQQLRGLYGQHDLFVMPTLGDSFGFVIVEAMASGLPAIVSTHAGAPVPNPDWRVPAHDSEAIRERILYYCTDRDRLSQDSQIAANFAAQLRPERYRQRAADLFRALLVDDRS